ncbi:hypothetical protein BD310DRAFT_50932 [Dichomitus squalens]|uniref:Uncharacterized protein n=1 Tax=Dichomitus squalens TaxID=114155 RepID=A0A4Q9Q5S5_9APHY|nr:hypothetical protein BD310DRAFT_50932 [Dichomitus squalens]
MTIRAVDSYSARVHEGSRVRMTYTRRMAWPTFPARHDVPKHRTLCNQQCGRCDCQGRPIQRKRRTLGQTRSNGQIWTVSCHDMISGLRSHTRPILSRAPLSRAHLTGRPCMESGSDVRPGTLTFIYPHRNVSVLERSSQLHTNRSTAGRGR